jgi:hypothetical protein
MKSTFVAGFDNGILRVMSHNSIASGKPQFIFQHVSKPHRSAITQVAISNSFMATTSADKTIFFYQIVAKQKQNSVGFVFSPNSMSILPIGFVECAHAVISMDFVHDDHSKDAFLLTVTEHGKLVSFTVPAARNVDNSQTFAVPLEKFQCKEWTFDLPKFDPQKDFRRKSIMLLSAEEPNLLIDVDSPIQKVKNVDNSVFLFSILNRIGKYELRAANLKSLNKSVLLLTDDAPFSTFGYSYSKHFILASTISGRCYLKLITAEEVKGQLEFGNHSLVPFENDQKPLLTCPHGNNKIESLTMSFDDAFMAASSSTGGLFIFRVVKREMEDEPSKELIPSPSSAGQKLCLSKYKSGGHCRSECLYVARI